jgi:hypothetical protein
MAGPKEIETRLSRAISAWERLTPAKPFGGMTVDQFKSQTAPSFTTRETIAALDDQMKQAINQRDAADETSLGLLQRFINGVLADPTEGPDSTLIEAVGRVRQSERKSGLTRKKSSGGKPPAS